MEASFSLCDLGVILTLDSLTNNVIFFDNRMKQKSNEFERAFKLDFAQLKRFRKIFTEFELSTTNTIRFQDMTF